MTKLIEVNKCLACVEASKGSLDPGRGRKKMVVMKNSCFHCLWKTKVNSRAHEDFIPYIIGSMAFYLSHVGYSARAISLSCYLSLSFLECEFPLCMNDLKSPPLKASVKLSGFFCAFWYFLVLCEFLPVISRKSKAGALVFFIATSLRIQEVFKKPYA